MVAKMVAALADASVEDATSEVDGEKRRGERRFSPPSCTIQVLKNLVVVMSQTGIGAGAAAGVSLDYRFLRRHGTG